MVEMDVKPSDVQLSLMVGSPGDEIDTIRDLHINLGGAGWQVKK